MTIPLLEWCEARIEARSLVINALLPLLHTTPWESGRQLRGGAFLSER